MINLAVGSEAKVLILVVFFDVGLVLGILLVGRWMVEKILDTSTIFMLFNYQPYSTPCFSLAYEITPSGLTGYNLVTWIALIWRLGLTSPRNYRLPKPNAEAPKEVKQRIEGELALKLISDDSRRIGTAVYLAFTPPSSSYSWKTQKAGSSSFGRRFSIT